jgi:2,4-dienoyl-CoA reductase-like NADH-dependent reductase (Old Yellow Enzyme family)
VEDLHTSVQSLFEPLTVHSGDITFRNRLVLAPMTTFASNSDGTITLEEIEFLRRRSRGVGMAITAASYVIEHGHTFDGQWSSASDEMLPSLRMAASAIREAGALAVLQLNHGGRLASSSVLGHQPLAPGAVAAQLPDAEKPRPMNDEEIEETIKAFGRATLRAIRAGFNGVEIHGGNGYLLQQFFSPNSNQRVDHWGGSLESRASFPIAVIEEVQEVVRRNAYTPFAIGFRLTPEEAENPGITMEDTYELVEGLAACRVDWITVSPGNNYFAGSLRNKRDSSPRAGLIARRVKDRTLVIGAGGIMHPQDALRVVDDGPQMVALGRALIVEPEWAQKVASGEFRQIRTCISSIGADTELNIPPAMYRKLLGRKGWLTVCPPDTVGRMPGIDAKLVRR